MAKNRFDLRFGIKRHDDFVSMVWRLWITKAGDVYLSTRRMGGITKYSFHQSGICREAFTTEHGTPTTMTNRAMLRWLRAETPVQGLGEAARVVWIAFPSNFLSRNFEQENANVHWIAAAPSGGATYLEMGYTNETEESVRIAFAENGKLLHSYTPLPTNEAFFVASCHCDWENHDVRSPPAEGSIFSDLLFSANDPADTGRPIRITIASSPNDGDALVIQELGGYKIQA